MDGSWASPTTAQINKPQVEDRDFSLEFEGGFNHKFNLTLTPLKL